MSKNKLKPFDYNDVIKAMHKGNRELQFERNGGGQWVAIDRPWKNKKKYDRKRDRRIDADCLFHFYAEKDFLIGKSFQVQIIF